MDSIVIQGGARLEGEVTVSGSKNASLPLLFATLLSPERSVVRNVPALADVETAIEVLRHLGARISRSPEGHEVIVDPRAGQLLVLGDGGGDRDVPDVQEVVRDTATLLGCQLGGTDVHPSVELHGVGVDDLAAEPLGQEDAQIGLSGRGGPDDGDDPRGGGCTTHRPSLANHAATARTSYVTARPRGRCLLRGPGRRFPGR